MQITKSHERLQSARDSILQVKPLRGTAHDAILPRPGRFLPSLPRQSAHPDLP
jgi:hypothetical protein